MRLPVAIAAVLALAVAGLWALTAPGRLPAGSLAGLAGDAARGELVFWAGGCASCHAAEGARDAARLVLSGGRRLPSAFGTFVAPNISPHPEAGIGGWSLEDFAAAMILGVSPEGEHYYPAFPYTSYVRATPQDIADLWAFLQTLPPDATPSAPHEIGFPFSIRRALGLWKLLYAGDGGFVLAEAATPEIERGRYLAEALGHCGECHTPRNALGGLETARWLAGAPNPAGPGTIPNITPARLTWSQADIAAYLRTGFTPEFDTAGGHMAEVVRNLANLPEADLAAIAAYLKAVPPAE
ncbi:MAG: cytochrome c [Rhodobacteraceae bacterium]|nr:cytochrome c [Paracoccaceae bacterium]